MHSVDDDRSDNSDGNLPETGPMHAHRRWRVVAANENGIAGSASVILNSEGKGSSPISIQGASESLTLIIGPESNSDEELLRWQSVRKRHSHPISQLSHGNTLLTIEVDRRGCSLIPIYGLFGETANVDFYQMEWSNDDAATWHVMPLDAIGGFPRFFWGPSLTDEPGNLHTVQFLPALLNESWMLETREHFESRNEPESWGVTRFWVRNRDLLFLWLTDGSFAPMSYQLRLRGWNSVDQRLDRGRVLPMSAGPDGVFMTIDCNDSVLTSAISTDIQSNLKSPISGSEFDFAASDITNNEGNVDDPISIEITINYRNGRSENRVLPIANTENIASDLISLLNLLPETSPSLKETLAQFRGVRRKFGKTRNRRH
jgi:hypothetical protein